MSLPREGARVTREGIVVATAMDWCRSPQAIVPYRIYTHGQIEGASTAGSVRQTDEPSYVKGSLIKASYGDEAGVGGGVLSGTHGAKCEPKTYSSTVKIEDKGVVRDTDELWMNDRNTYGKLIYQVDTKHYPTHNHNDGVPRIQLAQAPMRAPMPMPLEPPPPVRAPAINDNVPVIPGPGRAPVIPSPNSPAPSTDTFLQQYRSTAQRNDDGSWTFFTKLGGPLSHVRTFDFFGNHYILAEPLPSGKQIVSREELENFYQETLKKQGTERKRDAAALGRNGMRVTRKGVTRLRCWSLDGFLKKRGVSDTNHPLVKEYCRQLFEQARGLNSMTPSEYINEREWFKAHGRLNDQAEFREEYLQKVVNDMLKRGEYTSLAAARAAAEKSIFGLVPLHTPDQVVGGRLSVIERLGLDSVNSSIGGGWPARTSELDAIATETKRNNNKNLNVSLCAEFKGQIVCESDPNC